MGGGGSLSGNAQDLASLEARFIHELRELPEAEREQRLREASPDAIEACVFGGNRVEARAEAVDMYHVRIELLLAETVSGCGSLPLKATFEFPEGREREHYGVIRCEVERLDVPGKGTQGDRVQALPQRGFTLALEIDDALPYFRRDGTPEAGEYPVVVTSVHGHLRSRVTVRPALQGPGSR